MNEKMDMRISGSSTMPGGEYDRVSISGSGTVQGDLRCQSLSCSGSARVQGDVDCAGEVRSSGSSKVTGSITCESLSCSGAVKCEGSILSRGLIHSSGAMKVSGSLEGGEVDVSGGLEAADIRCQELRCSGAMNVSGGVEAEAVRISGMAGIPGLLNAETVEIAANRGIRIGSIFLLHDLHSFAIIRNHYYKEEVSEHEAAAQHPSAAAGFGRGPGPPGPHRRGLLHRTGGVQRESGRPARHRGRGRPDR